MLWSLFRCSVGRVCDFLTVVALVAWKTGETIKAKNAEQQTFAWCQLLEGGMGGGRSTSPQGTQTISF